MLGKTVGEFDGAVVTDVQPRCYCANAWLNALLNTFQRQQKLMLLWIDIVQPRGLFTEMQKTADLIPEFSQRPIVVDCELLF